MKFIHIIKYLHKIFLLPHELAQIAVNHFAIGSPVAFILHFVHILERFNGLNEGFTLRFDKIGHIVNKLMIVIRSHPYPNSKP